MKSSGLVIFDPMALRGNKDVMFKPFWCIVQTQDDTDAYYKWFIEKRYGIKIQRPAWGCHVSVIRGEPTSQECWNNFKQKYNNIEIEFEHCGEIYTNGNHWWLQIYCERLKDIREEMGYSRDMFWDLHLTLGVPIPQQIDHSFYIWRNIQKFEPEYAKIEWKDELN